MKLRNVHGRLLRMTKIEYNKLEKEKVEKGKKQ